MAKDNHGVTPAIRVLKENRVTFVEHPYRYEEKGGTETAAKALGVDEHAVIKTLVMEDDHGTPFMVLMHGDRQVSAKVLARAIGARAVAPCAPLVAQRHTGYMVGGTSPFGTRKPLAVYLEQSVLGLPSIYINAGKRGLLVQISPGDLMRVLSPKLVRVAR